MTTEKPNKRSATPAKSKAKSTKTTSKKSPARKSKPAKSIPATKEKPDATSKPKPAVKSRSRTQATKQAKPKSTRKRTTKAKSRKATDKQVEVPTLKQRKPVYPVRWASRTARKPTPDTTRAVLKSQSALLAGIESYFQWCKDNPWIKSVGVDRDGNVIQMPRTRPYLVEGLCKHIGISRKTWYAIQDDKNDKCYREDLMNVIEYANNVLYEQKVTGAVVEDYNANIVSRLVALGDVREVTGQRSKIDGKAEAIKVQIDSEVEFQANQVVKKLLAD